MHWDSLTKAEAQIVRETFDRLRHFRVSSFRILYDSSRLRIISTQEPQYLQHWLHLVKKSDVIICGHCWHRSKERLLTDRLIFRLFDIPLENLYFRCDTEQVVQRVFDAGFCHACLVNHNCFLDENLFNLGSKREKKYHAALVSRRAAFKRNRLANKVKELALIVGQEYQGGIIDEELPNYAYRNDKILTPEQVKSIIQQSCVGLCLSEEEGACLASSEYLLCGIPVVSTPSRGGRDIWYTETNSRICQPTPDSVAECVEHFVQNPPDPIIVRNEHIRFAKQQRGTFMRMLGSIFARFGIQEDVIEFWDKNFCHKWMQNYTGNDEIIKQLTS